MTWSWTLSPCQASNTQAAGLCLCRHGCGSYWVVSQCTTASTGLSGWRFTRPNQLRALPQARSAEIPPGQPPALPLLCCCLQATGKPKFRSRSRLAAAATREGHNGGDGGRHNVISHLARRKAPSTTSQGRQRSLR